MANRRSRERFQKRRKNTDSATQAIVVAPCMKMTRSSVGIPDTSQQENGDPDQSGERTQQREVDLRHDQAIDHEDDVVEREAEEAEAAPQEQAAAAGEVAADQQDHAED